MHAHTYVQQQQKQKQDYGCCCSPAISSAILIRSSPSLLWHKLELRSISGSVSLRRQIVREGERERERE